MKATDALGRLANSVELTRYEAGSYPNGDRRFDRIVRMATIDCVKAGWLLKTKGVWSITEAGKDALRTNTEPDDFYRQATKLFREWKNNQNLEKATPEDPPLISGDETTRESAAASAEVTFEQAKERAWSEIEQFLSVMNPFDFQDLFASLLRAMGYHILWISPPGRDGGLDIVANLDPLGTRPPRIK